MKPGVKVAGAIGVGYLLGRNHKMRMALTLGTAAAVGQLGRAGNQLKERAAEKVTSSDNLGKLADPGKRLLEAGGTAAMAAVTSRIDAVSDQLHERAETLRQSGAAGEEEKAEEAGGEETEGEEAEAKKADSKESKATKDNGGEAEAKESKAKDDGKKTEPKESKAKKDNGEKAEGKKSKAKESKAETTEDEEAEDEDEKADRAGKKAKSESETGAPVRRKEK